MVWPRLHVVLSCTLLLASSCQAKSKKDLISVDDATERLSLYFYKLKHRYNLVIPQEKVQQHLRNIDNRIIDSAGKKKNISQETFTELKKKFKEYLKFMYPDNFSLSTPPKGLYSQGIARKRIKAELMHHLKTKYNITDPEHQKTLYHQVKENIINSQLKLLSLAENDSVTISKENIEKIIELSCQELSNILVPRFSGAKGKKAAKSKKARSKKRRQNTSDND